MLERHAGNKKLSYGWQTTRRICANAMAWLNTPTRPHVLPWRIWLFCGVGINTGETKNWGALKLHSLGMRGVADPKTRPTLSYIL